MKIEKKAETAVVILNLANLHESVRDPSLISLLSDGWEIFCHVPVEDNGPKIILFLKKTIKPQSNKEAINFYHKANIIILLLIVSLMVILSTF